MDNDLLRSRENNDIIDHAEAIRVIVSQKCARCNGAGCMGCLFDSLDCDMIPAMLDKILNLMAHLPNERQNVVNAGRRRYQERKQTWREITSKKDMTNNSGIEEGNENDVPK